MYRKFLTRYKRQNKSLTKLYQLAIKSNFIQNVRGPDDFISSCPSLVDILCYVDQKDILNCKLANRRINNVIKRNEKYLPRIQATLHLSFETSEEKGNTIKVCVSVCNGRSEEPVQFKLILSEREPTKVQDCDNRKLFRLFVLQGILIELSEPRITSTIQLLLSRRFRTGKPSRVQDGNKCFERTISTELRSVLELIFNRYYFTQISVKNIGTNRNAQEEYCAVLGDVFRSCRSKCTKVVIDAIAWQTIEKLRTQLDCFEVSLRNFTGDEKTFLEIFQCRCRYVVHVPRAARLNLNLIVAIIKKWEAGDYRYTEVHLANIVQDCMKAVDLYCYLIYLEWFNMRICIIKGGQLKIRFRRPTDNRNLILHFFDYGGETHTYYQNLHFIDE